MERESNLAFIDGQNLYYGTRENHWKIDFRKFRTYLSDKYHSVEAYYFLGYIDERQQALYDNLKRAGYILTFREHTSGMKGTKKGNVDTDIIFDVMRTLIERTDFDKIILVSGDGDYKRLVDYLIGRRKFAKILFPNRSVASSLYRKLQPQYFDHLDSAGIQEKIEYTKVKRSP